MCFIVTTVRASWGWELGAFLLNVGSTQILEKLRVTPLVLLRMESTEKCEAIITHFNGKYIKTPPGVPGEASGNPAERATGCYFQ